ncbi:MAG: hypothetical protein HYY16_12130 [Planctomycetes bacterium]|nr:hypothetical protein [Planctomycetota bacterium]
MRCFVVALALLASVVLPLRAQERPQEREGERMREGMQDAKKGDTEIRVYLMEKDRRSVDIAGISAKLTLTPTAGGKPQTVTLESVTARIGGPVPGAREGDEGILGDGRMQQPKADGEYGLGEQQPQGNGHRAMGDQEQPSMEIGMHGGQIKTMNGYSVELVSLSMPGAVPQPGMQEQPKERLPEGLEEMSYFRGIVDLKAPPEAQRPGMERGLPQWTAEVSFNIRGDTKTVRGFQIPFFGSLNTVVMMAEKHVGLAEQSLRSNNLQEVRRHAQHLVWILEQARIPQGKAEIDKSRQQVLEAARKIETTAAANKKEDVQKAVSDFRTKLGELQRHARSTEQGREQQPLQKERELRY